MSPSHAGIAWPLFMLVLVGCAQTESIQTYEGPALPDGEVAIVQQLGGAIARVVDVTRKATVYETADPFSAWSTGTKVVVKLAPGTYQISYTQRTCAETYGPSLQFMECKRWGRVYRDAVVALKAGHIYSTQSQWKCSFFVMCTDPTSLWISDETSREVIDGVAP